MDEPVSVQEALLQGLPPGRNKRALLAEATKKYELLLTYLRDRSLDDLFMFNKYVLKAEEGDEKFVPLGPFHKDLCNFVTDRKDKKKLILIPRSHLKSKLITIGYSIQQMLKNPKVRILVYSATWQMAVDLNLNIQRKLQGTRRIGEIWGDVTNGAKEWSQDRTRLAGNTTREPTLIAAGIDNNLVGGHFDIIIMDDVVNRDNVGTQDQIFKVIQRYKDSLDLLETGGQLIIIGTRWHDSDLYGWILDPSNDIKHSYQILIQRAYEGNIQTGEGFQALWPEKFSRKELQTRLREEGWAHFSAQYMNNPVPEEDAIFKKTWFQYFEPADMRGKLLNKFLVIDPALSLAKDADYTAMIIIGVDEYGYVYVLDMVRMKLSPHDIIDKMIQFARSWHISDIGIETVAFQKTLAYSLREHPEFKKRPFHITELKPNERTKEFRIRGLQPLYENRKVYHNKTHANTLYLEDELVRFPRSTHDDLIDALSYSLDLMYPAKQKTSQRTGRSRWLY